jgi:cell wall-associated NlpC family hydrolase
MASPRSVEARIKWMFDKPYPERRGLCANWVWKACRIPLTNSPDARAAYDKAKRAGYINTNDNPPRGAIVWWTGGSHGHGHVAISLGNRRIVTTDAYSKGVKTGEHSLGWVHQEWGLKYAGWSWSFAATKLPRS